MAKNQNTIKYIVDRISEVSTRVINENKPEYPQFTREQLVAWFHAGVIELDTRKFLESGFPSYSSKSHEMFKGGPIDEAINDYKNAVERWKKLERDVWDAQTAAIDALYLSAEPAIGSIFAEFTDKINAIKGIKS